MLVTSPVRILWPRLLNGVKEFRRLQMSTTSTSSLEQKLLTFFKEMALAKEKNNYETDREKFVFHMTDWQETLDSLKQLFSGPDKYEQDQANHILQDLFYHVLPHLNAAAEIYDDAAELYKMHNKRSPT
jgi:hypothetical protein